MTFGHTLPGVKAGGEAHQPLPAYAAQWDKQAKWQLTPLCTPTEVRQPWCL